MSTLLTTDEGRDDDLDVDGRLTWTEVVGCGKLLLLPPLTTDDGRDDDLDVDEDELKLLEVVVSEFKCTSVVLALQSDPRRRPPSKPDGAHMMAAAPSPP